MTILGMLFIILGIFGYLFWVKLYRLRNAALFAFASSALFSGVYLLVAESELIQLVFDQFVVISYMCNISYFLFMAGIWAFIWHTPWIGLKPVSRFMSRFHLLCAVSVIAVDLVSPRAVSLLGKGSFLLMVVAILVIQGEIIRAARREPQEAKYSKSAPASSHLRVLSIFWRDSVFSHSHGSSIPGASSFSSRLWPICLFFAIGRR